jgi:hypothetical protein
MLFSLNFRERAECFKNGRFRALVSLFLGRCALARGYAARLDGENIDATALRVISLSSISRRWRFFRLVWASHLLSWMWQCSMGA